MKNNKMVTFRIIIVLLFIVGLAVTTSSSMVIFNNYKKAKIFTPMTAVVVGYDKKDNGLRSIVIEYNLEEKYYKMTSKHYTKKPEKVGSEIRIRYNPENPKEIIWIDNNHTKKYFISGLISLGGSIVLFMVMTIINMITPKKKKLANSEKIDLPQQKEVVEEISNLPESEVVTETISEEQANKEEVITPELKVEDKVEVSITEKIIQDEVSQEPLPIPEQPVSQIEENVIAKIVEAAQEPVLPKIEQPKLVIQELPVDIDSPREAVTSNILDMTVAMPALTKEELTIELPIIKQD